MGVLFNILFKKKTKKLQQNEFKGLIGSIQWFKNQAASHLPNWKELHWAVRKERFLKVEKGQKQETISKEHIVSGKVTLLREMEGTEQVDYLTNADQVMPGWLVKGYLPGRGWGCH